MKAVWSDAEGTAVIKETARALGCDLCGVASIDRFDAVSRETNPRSVLPEAQSVIVIAKKFLWSTTKSASTIPYTIVRNNLSNKIDEITMELSYFIEENGYVAIPAGAIGPCNYNTELQRVTGLVSLKNAARCAGLGVIGKNTLLLTPQYGNMVWLGAVLTSVDLVPDAMMTQTPCDGSCTVCLGACPVGALDGGPFMHQKKCWEHAFGPQDGGEWRIKCHACRVRCPHAKGFSIPS